MAGMIYGVPAHPISEICSWEPILTAIPWMQRYRTLAPQTSIITFGLWRGIVYLEVNTSTVYAINITSVKLYHSQERLDLAV